MFRYVILTLIILLILAMIVFPLLSCSTAKTGKKYAIDSPMKSSRNQKSLSDARQDVEKSRRILDECLERYSGDETKCQREKENYDEDVETYANLQAN